MRQFNGRYTQADNCRHHRVCICFRGGSWRFSSRRTRICWSCASVWSRIRCGQSSSPIPRQWSWSSYRATAGETSSPAWLATDWVFSQFGQRVRSAQEKYRAFVAEGRGGTRPWEQLRGQVYLGSEEFVARHQPNRAIREIPRRQTQAQRPSLRALFE
jgi:hypothetical protein